MLHFDSRVWLLWALWVLLLPLKWLLAAASAVCVHEFCHMIAVWLVGGKVRGVTIAPFGARIEAEGVDGFKGFVCILAGPLGSFLLILLIHRFPLLGLCGLVQGVFNLLPLYPLDGGRLLLHLLERIHPESAEGLFRYVEVILLTLLFAGGLYASARFTLGYFPILLCIFMIIQALYRKRP